MANDSGTESLLSRVGSGIRGALSSIGSAFRRGLSSTGVYSLLQRVGIAPRPPVLPPVPRTVSGRPITSAEVARIRTERQQLIEAGASQERQTLQELELLNLTFQGQIQQSEGLRDLPRDLPIPMDILETALGDQRRQYAFIVRVFGVHRETQEAVARTITVASDRLMTPEEAEQIASELVEGSPIEVQSARILNVFERAAVA